MQGNDLMKLVLIAGGAYVLYEYVLKPSSTTTTTTTTPVITAQQAAQAQATTQVLNNIMADMQSHNQDPTQLYSVSQFNFYYQRARGISGPAPETLFPGADPGKLYTIQEWWSAMTGAGFSGFGLIANRVNPYLNPRGAPFGSNIMTNGVERAFIVRG